MMIESEELISRYEKLLKKLEQRYMDDPDLTFGELSRVLKESRTFMKLGEDLTEEQLDMVEMFLRRDLAEFARKNSLAPDSQGESAYTLGLENSIWQWLVEITDRSQLEWHELGDDLRHQGTYQSGEIVGLGELICDKCGHKMQFLHPAPLPPCSECEGESFSRHSLEP